jgi:predicted Zn-dependent protease
LEEAGQREALEMAGKAVDLDPKDVRTRLGYAEALLAAGQSEEAARQIRIIRQIDHARPADSDLRLTPKELERLDALDLLARLPTRPSSRP